MNYDTLFYKILYRLYRTSGFPIVQERLLSLKKTPAPVFRSLSIEELKKQLCAHVTEYDLHYLRKNVQSIMDGWLKIFHEPPIKYTPGVFQRHPRTGTVCSLVHWSRVQISHNVGDEDVKFIWELNRLSALDSLAASALIDGQDRAVHKACSLVKQWRAENPYAFGINWFSSMEAALRLLRLLLLQGLLKEFQCHTSEIAAAVGEHYRHVASLWPFTARTMMAGNHLIVELAALTAYEFMTDCQGYFYHKLTYEAEKQFLPDGGHYEGSSGYHMFVLSVLLYTQWLAQAARLTTPELDTVIDRAVKFIDAISGPDAAVPAFGDWDDGSLFRPFSENPRNSKDLIRFYRGRKTSPTKNISLSSDKWTLFPSTGMAVYQRADKTVLGFRASSVKYGHSHLDMLSLYLMSAEGPIILDSGTYAYNYSQNIRTFYRSPEAHSTLFSKKHEPLKPFRTFAWKESLPVYLLSSSLNVTGRYKLKDAGIVQRTVRVTKDGCLITDTCPAGDSWWSQFIVPQAEFSSSGVVVKNADNRTVLCIFCDDKKIKPLIKPHKISYYYGHQHNAAAVLFPVDQKIVIRLVF